MLSMPMFGPEHWSRVIMCTLVAAVRAAVWQRNVTWERERSGGVLEWAHLPKKELRETNRANNRLFHSQSSFCTTSQLSFECIP